MKKWIPIALLVFGITHPGTPAFSQTARGKQKAITALCNALNHLLRKGGIQHWAYADSMQVLQPFAIDGEGNLSVTTRYQTDSGYYLVKMEAPLQEMRKADLDIYLILVTAAGQVKVYKSDRGSDQLKLVGRLNLLHIGLGEEDSLEEIRRLLHIALLYYTDSVKTYPPEPLGT